MIKKNKELLLFLSSIVFYAHTNFCSLEHDESNSQSAHQLYPLHAAAKNRDLAQVASLLRQGHDVNARNNYMQTALHCSGRSGYLDVTQTLVESGASIDAQDENLGTPLHRAAEMGHHHVVRYLCTMGADVNAQDDRGNTPLHDAAGGHGWEEPSNEPAVQVLVACGADICALNRDNQTALHCAAKYYQEEIVKYLCNIGADKNAQDAEGKTPLHLACEAGYFLVIRTLIEVGANLNIKDNDQNTLLHSISSDYLRMQAEEGRDMQLEIAILFVAREAAIDAQNSMRKTPLHLAATGGNLKLIQFFISQGADPEAIDNNGDTVLHCAISHAGPQVIKFLWNKVVHFDARNDDRKTAIDLLFNRISTTTWEDEKRNLLERAVFLVRFGIFIDKKHKKVLEAKNQALLEHWNETASEEQKKQMLEKPEPVYLCWIQEEKERLLENDLKGTYIGALPRDLQGLLLEFVVSQTEKKRIRDTVSSDDAKSNKKIKRN